MNHTIHWTLEKIAQHCALPAISPSHKPLYNKC